MKGKGKGFNLINEFLKDYDILVMEEMTSVSGTPGCCIKNKKEVKKDG